MILLGITPSILSEDRGTLCANRVYFATVIPQVQDSRFQLARSAKRPNGTTLMADGAVRVISLNIDSKLYARYLSGIADGNVVSEF